MSPTIAFLIMVATWCPVDGPTGHYESERCRKEAAKCYSFLHLDHAKLYECISAVSTLGAKK